MSKFKAGQSGNPSGRPKRDTAQLAEKLKQHGESVLQVVVNQALMGDLVACKLILERLYPPIKPSAQPVLFNAPQEANLSATGQSIINGMANGSIAPDTGSQIINALNSLAKIIEVDVLTKRIEELEHVLEKKAG
jgi:hypothetical protein